SSDPPKCRPCGLEVFLVDGLEAGFFLRDEPLHHELLKILIERLHAGRLTRLNGRVHLRDLALANQVTNRGRADHDLVGRDAAAAAWAPARPPPIRFSSVCEVTARSDSESMLRTISFSAAGNTSTTRSIVIAAELVCSVPNTKWPVSAAVNARRIVSRSRISPTRMTSGSSRNAERNASLKPSVSRCTSRWFTSERLLSWTNSIGSSIVMM